MTNWPPEATIVVNGTTLTEAQSMTIRVALASHRAWLLEEGLGNDAHGRRMTEGYIARGDEIMRLMLASREGSRD